MPTGSENWRLSICRPTRSCVVPVGTRGLVTNLSFSEMVTMIICDTVQRFGQNRII